MRLNDIASFIKSANAGASMLTFDVGFDSRATFDHVRHSGALSPEVIAGLYPVTAADVQIYDYEPSLVIKITIPRAKSAGGVAERDFDGVQQFAPLLPIEIPDF
jgi:hypothetical protein